MWHSVLCGVLFCEVLGGGVWCVVGCGIVCG